MKIKFNNNKKLKRHKIQIYLIYKISLKKTLLLFINLVINNHSYNRTHKIPFFNNL